LAAGPPDAPGRALPARLSPNRDELHSGKPNRTSIRVSGPRARVAAGV